MSYREINDRSISRINTEILKNKSFLFKDKFRREMKKKGRQAYSSRVYPTCDLPFSRVVAFTDGGGLLIYDSLLKELKRITPKHKDDGGICLDCEWVPLDANGHLICAMSFDYPVSYSCGVLWFIFEKKPVMMDLVNRSQVIPLPTFVVSEFHDGLAVAASEIDGKYGYVDRYGVTQIEMTYDDCGDFSEGIAQVEKNARRFLINTNGEEIR